MKKSASKRLDSQLNISRRNFLSGAGALAVGAAVCAVGCQGASSEDGSGAVGETEDTSVQAAVSDAESAAKLAGVDTIETQLGSVAVLSVPEESVFTTEECNFIKKRAKAARRVAQAHLPYGTLIWASDNNVAACLLPCESSDPLAQIALLSLSSGNLHTVRKSSVGKKDGFQIFDVRANSQGAIWVEANALDGKWRIYQAKVLSNGTKLGKARLVEEGDSAWEMPSIAVCGDYAFWQLTPSPSASGKDLTSMLMRARFGDSKENAKCVYEAPGKMACALSASENGVAIAPRADLESGSGAYYQLTYIDAESGIVESAMALPSGMKPVYIGYGPTGFSFAYEAIYNYGDGISNLGTYVASGKDAPANSAEGSADEEGSDGENASADSASSQAADSKKDAAKSFGEWFRFPRSPFTSPAWMKNWFMVKSTSVVAGVDLANRRYFSIEPEHALQGYGEYLASEGALDKIVTFANIDYTPIGGQPIHECNVRIWELAD